MCLGGAGRCIFGIYEPTLALKTSIGKLANLAVQNKIHLPKP